MKKLYGYKESDVLGLIEYMKNKKGAKNAIFKGYAQLVGKSVGTVRNLYYAIAKLSSKDAEFCNKFLSGKPLENGKIVLFDKDEEREVLKKILTLKIEGYSVRSAINKITNGDQKLALRYQNKYRGAIKNDVALISDILKELKQQNPNLNLSFLERKKPESFGLERLKAEINFLYERLTTSIRKENRALKRENQHLALENLRLRERLAGAGIKNTALEYFKNSGDENAVN